MSKLTYKLIPDVGPDTGGLERASTPIGNSNHSAFISQSSNQHARGFKGGTTSEHEKGETTTADIIIIEPSSISLKPSGWVTTDSGNLYLLVSILNFTIIFKYFILKIKICAGINLFI